MSSTDLPTLAYSAPPVGAGAAAVRRVSVILATAFAFAGVLGALNLLVNVFLRLPVTDWIDAFAVSRSADALARAAQLIGAMLAMGVGAQFLRGRHPHRVSIVIAVCLLAGAQLSFGYEVIDIIVERTQIRGWQAAGTIAWHVQTTVVQLLIPLANLVWFTRPAVKRLYGTMPPPARD